MGRRRRSSTEPDWPALLDDWAARGLIERTDWDGEPLLATPEPTPRKGRPGYVKGAWFDASAVEHFLQFALLLRHTIGKWRGAPIRLFDWQVRWQIGPALGWKYPGGLRIIRTVLMLIPRKNGKSTLASVLSLYLWCADREPGAQVYAAAGDKQQARVVYDAARAMAQMSKPVTKKAKLLRTVLEYPSTGSIFRALSSEGGRQHGLNVHGAVIDELHVHKSRGLVDALETGTGSREQPLVWIISTADSGEDDFSIFAEKYELIEQLAGGHVHDPSTFGVVFAAAATDDPFLEVTWRRANPGIELTISIDYIRREAARAKATPGYLNEFLRLHLNIRTKQATRWFDMASWDACGLEPDTGIPIPVELEELAGRYCYGGLDLSATADLTAYSLWFPPDEDEGEWRHVWVPFFWLPEDNLPDLVRRTRVPFDRWAQLPGHHGKMLRLTEGNVVDYREIRKLVLTLHELCPVLAIGYDPWNATETVTELQDAGLTLEPVRQGYASMNQPAKALERLILARMISHGGHQLLRFNADCVEVKQDPNGNIKPVKPDYRMSSKRIDGVSSGLNALAMHLLRSGGEERSIYEDDDVDITPVSQGGRT